MLELFIMVIYLFLAFHLYNGNNDKIYFKYCCYDNIVM